MVETNEFEVVNSNFFLQLLGRQKDFVDWLITNAIRRNMSKVDYKQSIFSFRDSIILDHHIGRSNFVAVDKNRMYVQ